jgi:hypothetical protein
VAAKLPSTSELTDVVLECNDLTTNLGALVKTVPPSTALNAVVSKCNAMVANLRDLVTNFNAMTAQSDLIRSTLKLVQAPQPGIPVSGEGQAAFPPIGMVMDAKKVAWTFGSPLAGGGRDFIIKRNGVQYPVAGLLIVMKGGVVWINDAANNWWTLDANEAPVTSLGGPWGPLPQDLRSWNTKDGATIVASAAADGRYGSSAFIVDMNAAIWSFGAADGKDFVILRNGVPFTEPGFTTKPYSAIMIRLKNGVPWLQNAAGSWVYPPA